MPYLGHAVRVLTLVWLVVHFTLTALYVMPLNPVKMAIQPLLNATIGTYFAQDWSLFAPDPLSSTFTLLARPLTRAEAAASPATGLPTAGWQDLTMPCWDRFQQNRFSAYDRLTRPQINEILNLLNGNKAYRSWYDACRKGDKEACKVVDKASEPVRAQAQRRLGKIGSAYCNDIASPPEVTYVALRARERETVPWSKRHSAKVTYKDIDLGIYPIDRKVASPGMYRAGGHK